MAISSLNPNQHKVIQAIDIATRKKGGESFRMMLAQANRESSLNPDAQATTSSARGLHQFTRATWLNMIHKYGRSHGLSDLVNAMRKTPEGDIHIASEKREKEILALREDPRLNTAMALELVGENRRGLAASLGREPNATDLYLGHFAGLSGATTLLKAISRNPSQPAADLLPQAAKANPSIFNLPNGKPRSVTEVYRLMNEKISDALRQADDLIAQYQATPNAASGPGNTDLTQEQGYQEQGYQGMDRQGPGYQDLANKGPMVDPRTGRSTIQSHGIVMDTATWIILQTLRAPIS
ncbi:MAG: lytic transglycosylase domain-containing protein [Pseudomonadota bacterium]